MRNIWILVQNYINCTVGALKGKKKRAKNAMGGGLILVLFFALMAFLSFQAWSIGLALKVSYTEAGLEPVYTFLLYQGFLVGTVLLLFFALQNITGGAKANDADLLLSMPLTKIEIVTGKAFSKYLINLAVVVLFTVPYMLIYLVSAGFTIQTAAAGKIGRAHV